MKTKIVYALISSEKDIYTEQNWVSAWSLKYFNPESHCILITDKETLEGIKTDYRKDFLNYIDETITVPFDTCVSNKERSRIIKTSLRELVKGDFLFIDSDTIITESLEEIDSCQYHIGMVYDLHNKLSEYPFETIIRDWNKDLFGVDLKNNTDQYNSGVIYSKDEPITHVFFKRWHENWVKAKEKADFKDQPSLLLTCDEMPGVVEPLDGIWNCQIMISIAHLHKAKIIHFFNTQWKRTFISPFFGKDFYTNMKQTHELTDDMKRMILNCKSEFTTPSMPVMLSEVQMGRTSLYAIILQLFINHRSLYYRIEHVVVSILKTIRCCMSLFGIKSK